ncbi:MAG TPA: hypothetical protein VFB12_12265 [Ktedonobacteraceae bacterium]|nr:hypothetical protein [Ktedonobacteraceae bacterium]
MNFLALLTQNFWVLVALLLFIITIVSIVLGILLEAYKARIKSRQKILELRNEELRLRLKLEQQKKDTSDRPAARGFPLPKESSWDEQPQAHYEMGYQQQQQ